ncbi:MAG: hypothetical protein ABSC63_18420 [Candidatus Binataceae bacterium]|jgi:type II secretory pathway component PulC
MEPLEDTTVTTKSKKGKAKPRKTQKPKVGVAVDWKAAIKKAMRKKYPDAGWPED